MQASDSENDPSSLSQTSMRMIELQSSVFEIWEQSVRAAIPEAGTLRRPLLINSLPIFYGDIAEALTCDYPRKIGTDGNLLAAEHGGERARLTSYDIQCLLTEYQVFRWAIFEVLHNDGVQLSHDERMTINASVDSAIREAVHSFMQVHGTLRERFAAAITHDLRGPLGVAVVALEVSQMTLDSTIAQSMTVKALGQLRHMNAMINDLLHSFSYSGGQFMKIGFEHFDLMEIIKEIQSDTTCVHEARLVVKGVSVCGWWGRAELKRAIENIVTNAFKYGKDNGVVTIRWQEYDERVAISVHNEGEPIPLSEHKSIFDLYHRAESAQNRHVTGWGIGLAYVQAVAESHGGSVGLDSSQERGTTFSINIPKDCRNIQS